MFVIQTLSVFFRQKLYYKFMNYVDKLIALRQDRDLKQADIAKVLNRSRSSYANLENQRYKFNVDDIIKLCEYYNVSPEYVLGFTDEQKNLK